MIIAMSTVIVTMGALIGLGIHRAHHELDDPDLFDAHRGSQLDPHPQRVFRHLLSEGDDKQSRIRQVVSKLFTPMLYTSLTTVAGFGSLAFAPIPPVQSVRRVRGDRRGDLLFAERDLHPGLCGEPLGQDALARLPGSDEADNRLPTKQSSRACSASVRCR
jgi:hypothetical protein